jgi:AcrR family transcriptional regulator
MARRSDHTRDELYDLAMEAARATVEADGFRALTARTVAEAIGYSPGTLYNVFENLDDMIVHLNGRTLEALHDRLSAAARSGDPAADLMALLDGYLGYLGDHPNLWSLLFDYTLPEGRDLPDWYVRRVGRVMGLVEEALAPLFGAGESEARGNAARTIWAGLHGICSLADTGKLRVVATQPVREMAETLLTHFVTGLRAERGGARL